MNLPPPKREEISDLVLTVLRGLHFDTYVDGGSEFGVDILLDRGARSLYYYAIRMQLEKLGYEFFDFSPEDCQKAERVQDIIDAVWRDLGSDNKRTM